MDRTVSSRGAKSAYRDDDFEQCSALAERLGDQKNWQGRIAALRELQQRLNTYGCDEAYLSSLRDSKCAAKLGDQLLDLRSEVTKEACATVVSLTQQASSLPAFPGLVVEVLSGPLLKLVAVPHKVMSDQGHGAATTAFGSAQSHRMLARLSEAQTDKRAPILLRARCAEYLRNALQTWSEEVLSRDLESVETAILAGVGDASGDVRRLSKASFELYRDVFGQRAARLLSRMDAAGQKLINTDSSTRDSSPARNSGGATGRAASPRSRPYTAAGYDGGGGTLRSGSPPIARGGGDWGAATTGALDDGSPSLSPPSASLRAGLATLRRPATRSMSPPLQRYSSMPINRDDAAAPADDGDASASGAGASTSAPSASVAAALSRIRRLHSLEPRPENGSGDDGTDTVVPFYTSRGGVSPPPTARYRAYRQAKSTDVAPPSQAGDAADGAASEQRRSSGSSGNGTVPMRPGSGGAPAAATPRTSGGGSSAAPVSNGYHQQAPVEAVRTQPRAAPAAAEPAPAARVRPITPRSASSPRPRTPLSARAAAPPTRAAAPSSSYLPSGSVTARAALQTGAAAAASTAPPPPLTSRYMLPNGGGGSLTQRVAAAAPSPSFAAATAAAAAAAASRTAQRYGVAPMVTPVGTAAAGSSIRPLMSPLVGGVSSVSATAAAAAAATTSRVRAASPRRVEGSGMYGGLTSGGLSSRGSGGTPASGGTPFGLSSLRGAITPRGSAASSGLVSPRRASAGVGAPASSAPSSRGAASPRCTTDGGPTSSAIGAAGGRTPRATGGDPARGSGSMLQWGSGGGPPSQPALRLVPAASSVALTPRRAVSAQRSTPRTDAPSSSAAAARRASPPPSVRSGRGVPSAGSSGGVTPRGMVTPRGLGSAAASGAAAPSPGAAASRYGQPGRATAPSSSAPPPQPQAAPKGRVQEDDILRSIAHLDALIANIHARGAARGKGGSGPSTPAAGASRGGSGSGSRPAGVAPASPYSSSSGGVSRGRSGGSGAADVRDLLSPATRALLGMQ